MVVDRRRRRAHRASRDARLSTGYERAIDSLKTSEKRGFHEVDGALCRSRMAPASRRSAFASAHATPRSPPGPSGKSPPTISGDYPGLDFFVSICHIAPIEGELTLWPAKNNPKPFTN